jgi:hypothetical protein
MPVTAQIMSLKRAIKAHVRRAIEENKDDSNTIKNRRIIQVMKILAGL